MFENLSSLDYFIEVYELSFDHLEFGLFPSLFTL